jgi:hypothetical protein
MGVSKSTGEADSLITLFLGKSEGKDSYWL